MLGWVLIGGGVRGVSKIPASVAKELGHYVYLYINPIDQTVFYVGKGVRGRAFSHLGDDRKRELTSIIRKIQRSGAQPRIEILAHKLPDHRAALQIEAAAISLLGLPKLANRVSGWRHTKFGRMAIDELVARYARARAEIREPAILFRITKLYRHGMSEVELYDATRAYWRVAKAQRERAKLALAVFEDTVREVYSIEGWHPGGSTFNVRTKGRRRAAPAKWEFVGTIATPEIRDRYLNRYVGHLLKPGGRNPVRYVNLE